MRVALGSDHGGFELKQEIIKYLEEKNIEYKDYGCYSTGNYGKAGIWNCLCCRCLCDPFTQLFMQTAVSPEF